MDTPGVWLVGCLVAASLGLSAQGAAAGNPGNTDPGEESEQETLDQMKLLAGSEVRSEEALREVAARLNLSIVSASNRLEPLWGAPATVIVISREEIAQRGYRDLSQILDDLPGMDVARAYGDTYLKDYWRGYRNTIGDPFLVLVDGVNYHSLWIHNSYPTLLSYPVSSVERVEVVYGPASVVYGADAFMGVINIITAKEPTQSGSSSQVTITAGSNLTRIADGSYRLAHGAFRFNLGFRFDNGLMDAKSLENYEYTKNKYQLDPRLWADAFRLNPNLGGLQTPERARNRALTLGAAYGDTEAGFVYTLEHSGYGAVYPGDQALANGGWSYREYSLHLRHAASLSDTVNSTTLVRWRGSDTVPDSNDVEGYYDPGQGTYLNRFSYWGSLNSSVTLTQDFDWWLNWRWSFNAGLKYEQKNLQRDYDHSDPAFHPIATPVIPPPLSDTLQAANRVVTEDWGAYALAKFRLTDRDRLHVGLRRDHNSTYGGATTLRAGWVGNYGAWGLKALYGQAFQEPSARALYGGYFRSGGNSKLQPERSHTTELSVSYASGVQSHLLSLYTVKNTGTVTGTQNLGDRTVTGLDYHVQAAFPLPHIRQLKLWGYYSRYLKTRGSPDGDAGLTADGRIGDLAPDKLWAGATADVSDACNATLRARYVGARPTVASNPVGRVGAYGLLDLNVNATHRDFTLSLSVTNLFDRVYFQPGIRSADAGLVPGAFVRDAAGVTHWLGAGGTYDSSGGFYNSLLPQPGREINVSLTLRR